MRIACVGGGTGGHIFPGIAVIEELKKRRTDLQIVWIGSGKQLERDITSRFDIPYYAVPSGKLRRYFSLRNFIDIFRLAAGFFASLVLLGKLKADILFSKGGYVAVAPVMAASVLGIPVVTHESDRDPGLATRIITRFADTILLSYEQTRADYFEGSPREVVVTGNPVRSEILQGDADRGREMLGIEPGRPIVLVLGGSQGARQINDLIRQSRDGLLDHAAVVHQMGRLDYEPSSIPHYITAPIFNEEFPDILAAADLVISRAGAGTVWENGAMGKAAILIPLGSGSSRGDQVRNAELFVQEGAAFSLQGEEAESARLLELCLRLLKDPQLRRNMGDSALRLCDTRAADRIAGILLSKAADRSVDRGKKGDTCGSV
ncbi:MAG: undecaprenyldiphospho-muramoylpentapeptide beta-N-acetylglucosaminyltransferase [Spirochaetota bacterium]|nr:undecaprenyldiphospho-muramoylpentapeptide beta-N-acetylglucosaminyltransferase [Spirochaetota bacterium]